MKYTILAVIVMVALIILDGLEAERIITPLAYVLCMGSTAAIGALVFDGMSRHDDKTPKQH